MPAFDLGFLVPLGVFTAVPAWRRQAAGYVLATTVVVKAAAMGAAITAMLLVEWVTTGVFAPVPIAVFALVSLIAAAIGWRVYGSVLEHPTQAAAPGEIRGRAPASA